MTYKPGDPIDYMEFADAGRGKVVRVWHPGVVVSVIEDTMFVRYRRHHTKAEVTAAVRPDAFNVRRRA